MFQKMLRNVSEKTESVQVLVVFNDSFVQVCELKERRKKRFFLLIFFRNATLNTRLLFYYY